MTTDSAPLDTFPTLLAVIEQSPVGVLLLDADGAVAFENDCARAALGASCLGCAAAEMPGLSRALGDALAGLAGGVPFQGVEAAVEHADGTRRVVVASGTPVRGGDAVFAVTLADVTERAEGAAVRALNERVATAEAALRRAALGHPDALALLEAATAHAADALGAAVGAAFVGAADGTLVRCVAVPPDALAETLDLAPFPDARRGQTLALDGRRLGLDGPGALLLPVSGAAPGVIALGRAAPFSEAERLAGARLAALFSTLWAWTDAEARFQRTVADLDDALFTVALDGPREVVFVTPQIEALTGLDADAILAGDADWAALVHDDDRAAFDAHTDRLRAGEPSRIDVRIGLPGGETVWLSERATPGVDAAGRAVAGGLVSDVTAQKEAEATLDRARRVAERAADARMAFLRLMSHELRTPLGAIRGFADLLASEVGEMPQAPPVVAEFTGIIGEAANRALRLVSDLLDLARLETGSLDLARAPVDLSPLVRAQAARVETGLTSRGVALHVEADAPALALADAARVEQIVAQLAANAAAFTESGSVVFRVEALGAEVCVSVTDTGAGMDEVFLESLFEPFAQEDTRVNRDREGTGLGLAIARRLAEAMGGRLTAQSEKGAGSAFRLVLPAA